MLDQHNNRQPEGGICAHLVVGDASDEGLLACRRRRRQRQGWSAIRSGCPCAAFVMGTLPSLTAQVNWETGAIGRSLHSHSAAGTAGCHRPLGSKGGHMGGLQRRGHRARSHGAGHRGAQGAHDARGLGHSRSHDAICRFNVLARRDDRANWVEVEAGAAAPCSDGRPGCLLVMGDLTA